MPESFKREANGRMPFPEDKWDMLAKFNGDDNYYVIRTPEDWEWMRQRREESEKAWNKLTWWEKFCQRWQQRQEDRQQLRQGRKMIAQMHRTNSWSS